MMFIVYDISTHIPFTFAFLIKINMITHILAVFC